MWQSNLLRAIIAVVPFVKRKGKFMAWTRVFVSYISTIYETLKVPFRQETIRKAYITPQVCMLEKYLNDRLGVVYITDGQELGPWLFYDDDPDIFYLDRPDSFVWGVNDTPSFIVNVPNTFPDALLPELIAIVNKYKLPGKSFIIYKYVP